MGDDPIRMDGGNRVLGVWRYLAMVDANPLVAGLWGDTGPRVEIPVSGGNFPNSTEYFIILTASTVILVQHQC